LSVYVIFIYLTPSEKVSDQREYSVAPDQSTSQPAPGPTHASQATRHDFPRSHTIPMSQVVTEPPPQTGRMKWYLWGHNNEAGEHVQGGDGAQ
jgi:hypothetical protein